MNFNTENVDALKRYESTEVDRRTWLHVPSGTTFTIYTGKSFKQKSRYHTSNSFCFQNVFVPLLRYVAKDVTSSLLSLHKGSDFNAANFDDTANENARYKRNELEHTFSAFSPTCFDILNWILIQYMTLFFCTTDKVRVSLIFVKDL